MEIRDLSPQKDPKGGSPRTPRPTPVREFQEAYPPAEPPIMVSNGNGAGLWKAIAGVVVGLLAGMTVAWFTAFHERGVTRVEMEEFTQKTHAEMEQHVKDALPKYITRQEMEEYVKTYSPWVFDKQVIVSRLAAQDQQIGEVRTKIDLATKVIDAQKR